MNMRGALFVLLMPLLLAGCRGKSSESDLFSDDPGRRQAALARLEQVSPERRAELIGIMITNLSHEDSRRVARAADVLVAFGKPSVEPLRPKLQDPDPFTRITAANTLGRIGKDNARAALPDIIALSKDPHPLVRAEAAHALALSGTKASRALLAVLELSKDENADVRDAASQALAVMRPDRFGSPPPSKKS